MVQGEEIGQVRKHEWWFGGGGEVAEISVVHGEGFEFDGCGSGGVVTGNSLREETESGSSGRKRSKRAKGIKKREVGRWKEMMGH